MNLYYGMLGESVKYHFGNSFSEAWARAGEPTENEYYQKKSIRIQALKNDFGAFQVILKADECFLLSVTKAPGFSPITDIPVIRLGVEFEPEPGLATALSPVALVQDDDGISRADILLQDESVFVRRGEGQPVWVETQIPEDITAKVAKGRVVLYRHAMFEDETEIGSLCFQIDILDLAMPELRDYSFFLDLWQHPSNIARKHETRLWSDAHFDVLERYVSSLARLGQKTAVAVVSDVPWAGQRCFAVRNYPSNMYEYNMVSLEMDAGGALHADFEALDRYIGLCFRHGIDREIELIGLLGIWQFPQDGFGKLAEDHPDALRLRYYDRKSRKFRFARTADEIRQYIRLIERHFVEKGWIDIVRVVADEPADIHAFREKLDDLTRTAPRLKCKVAVNRASFAGHFRDHGLDLVPSVECLEKEYAEFLDVWESARGRRLWYVCCGNRPDSCIRAPLTDTRLIGWMTAFLDLQGLLRWNFTAWPEKPRENIRWNYPNWPAGETNFVYPGNDGRPLLTLRYKGLQRAVRDYELIMMLKRVDADADGFLESLFDRLTDGRLSYIHKSLPQGQALASCFSLRYEDYEDAIRSLAEKIVTVEN